MEQQQTQSQSHPTAYLSREEQQQYEQQQYEYQYVEYEPYYLAPMAGYMDDRRPFTAPFGAVDPRAATFAALPLARRTSLGARVRNGLRRLGRALNFRRRRKDVVADDRAYYYYDGAEAYDYDEAYYSDQAYDYDRAYGYGEAELEGRQRPYRREASRQSLSRPSTIAGGAEEDAPGAPVARAVFFDGIVDRAGHLASPPAAAAAAVTQTGPSAAARRRAKFDGDDDDLYNRTVGRDAESGVIYREARYK